MAAQLTAQRLLQRSMRRLREAHLLPKRVSEDGASGGAAHALSAEAAPLMHVYNRKRAADVLRLLGEAAEKCVLPPRSLAIPVPALLRMRPHRVLL